MYSYSRDGETVFLLDPAGGLAIPLLLHLASRRIEIRMPHVDDLAEHYVDASTLRALKAATGDHGQLIDATMRFGRYYSDLVHEETHGDTVSLRDLRRMIQRHYEKVGTAAFAERPATTAHRPVRHHDRLAFT